MLPHCAERHLFSLCTGSIGQGLTVNDIIVTVQFDAQSCICFKFQLRGGPKKSVFSKNENRPWWGFFEKKIHDQ